MALEQQRGISVTSSVMQFPYDGRMVNLLDTPGHEDFSEDTYRILTAVDSALMVIDCAKGVEARTIKLMEVCRLRDTPIMTFINKLDREGREPIELLDEIERVLRIALRAGHLADRHGPRAGRHLSPARGPDLRLPGGREGPRRHARDHRGPRQRGGRRNSSVYAAQAYRDEVELVRGASHAFDLAEYRAGRQTPVFFGSAINNFGVTELLNAFVEVAPSPLAARDHDADRGAARGGASPASSSRSRPTWTRGTATASRSCASARAATARACACSTCAIGKEIRVGDAVTFLAADRQHTDEAYAGDIIGLHNHGTINIGDTLHRGREAHVHRHPELRAGTVPSRGAAGPAAHEGRCRRASTSCARRAPRSSSGRCATTT